MTKTLRLLLWNQLNFKISSLVDIDKKKDVILLAETKEDATHVKHHKKKLILIFSAMRHFAGELKEKGYKVEYSKLTDQKNTQTLQKEVKRLLKKDSFERVVVTHPADYRHYEVLVELETQIKVPLEIREDTHFLSTPEEFKDWAGSKKQLRMEFFYREMRKKHNILMTKSGPAGGEWNYDQENRSPPKSGLKVPSATVIKADKITSDVIKVVEKYFPKHFGESNNFTMATTRKDALRVLDSFIKNRLPSFGVYQDAMIEGEPWMFHSHISFYLNIGLITPLECVEKAERAWKEKKAPINSVEGFIRQIVGWREYVRGVYWLKMPGYKKNNFLKASRMLPDFFWTGKTDLNCLAQCIDETKKNAYAHHIQRLMVLGNFFLLTGVDPKWVNEWYLIVYADAHEWVELPNVSGMILYADGGFLASKPYAASGAYINKMSTYCRNCKYSVKEKVGEGACPFNYLYWSFLIKNKAELAKNPRLRMPYNTLQKMPASQKAEIEKSAKSFFNKYF